MRALNPHRGYATRMVNGHAIIVGGGIGGLTAAIALQRVGLRATVLERVPELRPVGAGIVLAVNALSVLKRLGVAERVIAAGATLTEGLIADAHRGTLATTPLEQFSAFARAPMVAFHREELQSALLGALPEGTVRLGAVVTDVSDEGAVARAHLDDGQVVEGDVVIGADGLHSVVRRKFLGDQVRYSGQTSWRGVTRATDVVPAGRSVEIWGPGLRFGYVSLTRGRVYWFAVADGPQGGVDVPGQRVTSLQARYQGWPPEVTTLIGLTQEDAIVRTDIVDRDPVDGWTRGRITLLGDAAHPMTPNLGQGAGQAIEDALVLGEELGRPGEPGDALGRYEARRAPRVKKLVLAARRFGEMAHWRNPVARGLRNAALRVTPTSVTVAQFKSMVFDGMP